MTKNKTITIKVRFFTNDLLKQTAYRQGSVEVEANSRHGIRHKPGGGDDLFHSLDEIGKVVVRVARAAGVKFNRR